MGDNIDMDSEPAGSASASTAGAVVATDSEFRKPGAHEKHPFFHYYGLLIHQQNMMQDAVRTSAYANAIAQNSIDFRDKTVMDVGTGSGILAWFAVKAGARKVYAVEASGVAKRAAALMDANGLSGRIVVLQQTVETVVLPPGEVIDIIVSEPMGFMLIHERMLESYIIARDMFLRPGGRMFPSTGTILAAPFTDPALWAEQMGKIAFWYTTDFYGLDLTCLADDAAVDHFSQPVVGYVDPTTLLCNQTVSHAIDFEKDAPASLHDMTLPFDFVSSKTALCHGLAVWFDVSFIGSTTTLVLSTSPYAPGTHWYQCRLLLKEPLAVNVNQRIAGELHMVANDRYSYNLTLRMHLVGSEASTTTGTAISSTVRINLHDQLYHYLSSPAAAPAAGH